MVPLRFLDSGETMLVVEFGDTVDARLNERVHALDAALRAAAPDGVIETVPTFRSLAVHYEPLVVTRDDLIARIRTLEVGAEVATRQARLWTVPACYEAPHAEDLAEAAARLAITPERLIDLHRRTIFRIHMYGFAPGFAYLGGLPDELAVPRRDRPRPPHPANAIMIGGGLSAVASFPMPTGWWVIGRSAERMFAPGRTPTFLVEAGDQLRFEAVDATTFAALEARVAAGEIVARSEAAP